MSQVPSGSAFAPFHHRVFAVLWTATLISNIGTWMFNVTSGWVMTDLSPSPLMVSLVQTATALPVFLFALPAGALGDIFDRRKLLLVTQLASAAALFIFAGLLWSGTINAWLLLAFTFVTGAGAAFAMPSWQAIVPRLVPRETLSAAIALNGVSINIARAVGPALGGFILVVTSATTTVTLDAISYLVVAIVLVCWRPNVTRTDILPRERLAGAMRAGFRFALSSDPLRNTIFRALAFFTFASAYWALLPLVAKQLLHGGPGLYGMLLTALGTGAVSGTFLIPSLKKRFNPDSLVALGTICSAIAMMLFAYSGRQDAGLVAGVIAGIAWIMVISSLNVSAQLALPDWVRARGLAIFQMMFYGAMTFGSLIWGQLAVHIGLSSSLLAATLLSLFAIPLTWKFKLNLGEHQNHIPSGHWPEPFLSAPIGHDRGPVLITLEYQIDPANRQDFQGLMQELGKLRRRDGAVQWGFFEDVAQPGRFIEMFIEESWVAHLRQHARVTGLHKSLQDRILALHRSEAPPRIMHGVAPQENETAESLPLDHHD